MWLSNLYITFYFFYIIFGYNSIYRYINNKPLDIVSFNYRSCAFIGKRVSMLSLIALLYSVYFFNNPNINSYINSILIHTVAICGYYIKWKIAEPITFYMHIFWIYPVISYTQFTNFIIIQT